MGCDVINGRHAGRAAGAALASALTGCVTVHIEAGDGEVRTVRHVGLLRVELPNPQQAIVGSVSGVGVVGAPLGWSLGYTRQRWALIGPECRAVVWLPPGGVNRPTHDALVHAAGVCLLAEQGSGLPTTTMMKEPAP